MPKEITGRHVFIGFAAAFGVIITVNLVLAVNAVRTFPGLEVKNTYVASQKFDKNRAAQEALGWDVSAQIEAGVLSLAFLQEGSPVKPVIESATLGHATHAGEDQTPVFAYDGTAFHAPVNAGAGNWKLRLKARAADGTLFQQWLVVEIK